MTVCLNTDSLNGSLLTHLLTVPGSNTGSTWSDLTGNHHATLPPGASFGTDQRPGGLAGAVRLDGSSFPTIAGAFSLTNFTVAKWVNLADVSAACDLLHVQTNRGGLWYYGAVPQLGWASTGTHVAIAAPWVPIADRWYHVAYARSGSTHTLYVDGVPIGTAIDATAQAAATNGLSIDHTGHVDDVRVWSVALAAGQILQVYRDSMGRHAGTLTFAGWHSRPAAVGFLGDSLVAGYLLEQKPGNIAASLLQAACCPSLVSTVSPGVSGAESAEYLPGQPDMLAAKALFVRHGVRHVMVMLGTNDCSDANEVTPAQFRENMLAICRDLTADGYTVLLNYPPAFVPPAYSVFTSTSLARLASYLPVLDSLVNGVTILQGDTTAYNDFWTNRSAWIQADNIHLTAAGNAALAQRWADVLALL